MEDEKNLKNSGDGGPILFSYNSAVWSLQTQMDPGRLIWTQQAVISFSDVMLDVLFSLKKIAWPHVQGMEPWIRRICSLPSYQEGEPEAVSIPMR